MLHWIKTYWVLLNASIRARMQYKQSFWIMMIGYSLTAVMDFLLIGMLVYKFKNIGGWSLFELALIYALSMLSMSFYRTFGSELNNFQNYIISGDFDKFLLKPMGVLTQVVTVNVDFGKISSVVVSIIIIFISFINLGIVWSVGKVFFLVITIISGIVIMYSLAIITASFAFWTTRTDELIIFMIYSTSNANNYPLDIYRQWVRNLLTFMLPLGFINYYPTLYLLNKTVNSYSGFLRFASPIAAILMVGAAALIWKTGLRAYQSTGS